MCSQGIAVPGLVGRLVQPPPESSATRKGAVWILAVADGVVVSADYYGGVAVGVGGSAHYSGGAPR